MEFLGNYLVWAIGIIVVGLPIGLMFYLLRAQKQEMVRDVNSLVCLTVSLPRDATQPVSGEPVKDFKDLIAPMEQFYSSLTTIIHQRNFVDWLFSTPAHISFEVTAVGGVIHFSIVCPKRIKNIVERQLHSYFPHAEVSSNKPPKLFGPHAKAVAGAVFEQSKSFVLPLKTYQYLETDPLSALTNALTKMKSDETASIQLLIRPTNERWRHHTHMAGQEVLQNRAHLVGRSRIGRAIGLVFDQAKPQGDVREKIHLSSQQEELIKALQEKGAKVGFEAILRVLTTAEDESSAESNLKVIIAAFSQFHAAEFNSLKYRIIAPNRLGRDYLFRMFSNAPKMILNAEELSSIFHLPTRALETPGVKWQLSRSLPPPADLPSDGVVIGETNYRGATTMVHLKEDDRRRHVFMIGKTGVGKTTLFESMIEQDMYQGKGLCFIDPLGDAIEQLIKKVPTERAKDVVLFDPSDTSYPLGLNLLEYSRPEEKDFLIQEVIEIFYKLFDPNRTGIVGPQWEHWARNAALTVMSLPGGGTLIDIPRLFTDDAFRSYAVSQVTDPVVKAFWEQQLAKTADFHKSEMYNYFISKFGRFMTNELMRNIIGQKESSFNFREMMDSGKILFVNLAKGKIGEINSNLLGLILVSKLQVAAFGRADVPEDQRRDFYLYVDEFQNFTTDSFATILAEARKYRLNLNITNQYFAQLTEQIRNAVIGNVGTLISYRIGADDAEFLSHELPGVTAEDLTNLDRFQAYVKLLVDLAPTKPFSMNGVKSPNEGSKQMADWIRNNTRSTFAKSPVVFESQSVGTASRALSTR
ncbi:MAG: type IV secretion system DNA-binding domain-containing protein [Candidatus Berkelbacteria bacterium]|nr:MAG: type IV secretion system DNA-binding domain-containing protein [Candidatus Berkelbacteria bacterium]QQG51425.1 MAG: type IV secretion system DNA-binding domain-containing protein [Candidatus Berkelbacteria bacterium]